MDLEETLQYGDIPPHLDQHRASVLIRSKHNTKESVTSCSTCSQVNMFLLQSLCFLFPTASALYSIHYYAPSGHAEVVGDELEFSRSPSAMQVADIYARLGGHAPIMKEGK